MTTRYDCDFYAWLTEQAVYLRAKQGEALDLHNLVEELDTLGRSERNAVVSYLEVLRRHLLTWGFQPDRRGRSWRRKRQRNL